MYSYLYIYYTAKVYHVYQTSLWRKYKDVKVVNLVSVQTAVQTGKKWMSIQTNKDIIVCDSR